MKSHSSLSNTVPKPVKAATGEGTREPESVSLKLP